jgi:hypothetical protein
MSTPPAPPSQQGYDRPYYGGGMPPVPAPSGELVVFLLVWFVLALLTLVTDGVDGLGPHDFATFSVALAIGFMLARGIAKAGKVFEGR